MSAWEAVREAIRVGDVARTADIVMALDEAGRREVAAELPGHIRPARDAAHERMRRTQEQMEQHGEAARREFMRAAVASGETEERAQQLWWSSAQHRQVWENHQRIWRIRDSWIEPMRVAGAGTIGGAAAVASWLRRREFRPLPGSFSLLLRVIVARPPEWQADLAVRLAARLRPTSVRDEDATLALALLRRSKAVPPEHDPLVVAWVAAGPGHSLADDPLLDHLLPRLFQAEGVGRQLSHEPVGPDYRGPWLSALPRLAAEGRVERRVLLEGCVSRFLRGGDATSLRFFARLHELLDPAPDEIDARNYLRLLPAAPGPVAELALRHLRRLGTLTEEQTAEAIEALLHRAESKLVRAGLSWLDQTARAASGDLDHLAPALGSAFVSESPQVQERAVRLAGKHAGRFTPVGAEAVRASATVLPPDLASRLGDAFGEVEVDEGDGFVPGELPDFGEPQAVSLTPLGEASLLVGYGHFTDGVAFERWLAGFVAAVARGGLRDAALPGQTWLYGRSEWGEPSEWAEALLREAVRQAGGLRSPVTHRFWVDIGEGSFEADFGRLPEKWRSHIITQLTEEGVPLGNLEHAVVGEPIEGEIRGVARSTEGWPRGYEEGPCPDRLPSPASVAAPRFVMLRRCAELYAALKSGALPPYLLATPTRADGMLDVGELVARLEGYERAGVRPLDADLQQALLRLPREVAGEDVAKARALGSEAGATLVRWLERRPRPSTRVEWIGDDRGPWPPFRSRIQAPATGLDLADLLLADPPVELWNRNKEHLGGWPLVTPADPDVAAMQLVPYLLDHWRRPEAFHDDVAALLDQGGPGTEGIALLLAWLLAERESSQGREPGVSLLLRAVARRSLPAAECGRQLGMLVRLGSGRLRDVLESLEECAWQGAHREVWQIVAGLLPVYLPEPGGRTPGTRGRSASPYGRRDGRTPAGRSRRWPRSPRARAPAASSVKRGGFTSCWKVSQVEAGRLPDGGGGHSPVGAQGVQLGQRGALRADALARAEPAHGLLPAQRPDLDLGQAAARADHRRVQARQVLVGGDRHQHVAALAQQAVGQVEQARQALS